MIICCGEALIDMLPRKLPDGSDVFLPASGGAVFNTAISLGRLGVETGFFSGISTDMLGRQLEKSLTDAKVNSTYCVRSDRPTTLAFVELVNGNATYTFYDEHSAGRMITLDDLPAFGAEVEALHFGAISLIPEPCGGAYEALAIREAHHRVISFDPNIRPNFIPDAPAHRARMRRMIAASDIVKVSDEDLAWIEPDKDTDAIIRSWLEVGVSIVVLTKGGDGASAFTARYSLDAPAPKTVVVDTVGAGDSFDGGFLAGLKQQGKLSKKALKHIERDDLAAALNLAVSVAAVTVSRAGANPPWSHELLAR